MRSSGVLLPVTSLPSPWGIGSMGKEAYAFVDFLASAGQVWWQILPIGPTGYGDSPYQSFSAFAGNPYWIDLGLLLEEGLLSLSEIQEAGLTDQPGNIDYGNLYEKRRPLLRRAASRVQKGKEYRKFCREHRDWLFDYALFMAIKEEQEMAPLDAWPEELRLRDAQAMKEARQRCRRPLRFWSTLQYLFFRQWQALSTYAGSRGVKIIGDIPIYISADSADLWGNPALFQLDENGRMKAVAGCPPDGYAPLGQRWGNPLYDWEAQRKTGYKWWIRRLSHAQKLFAGVRIDHFRGFSGYYAIPAECGTAECGQWQKGPSKRFVATIKKKLPELFVLAEDLGFLTQDVRELLAFSGFPGMKVLQFAFDGSENSDYLPHKYERNCAVYTGTHDNPTTVTWSVTAPWHETSFAREYLGVGNGDLPEAMVRAALACPADLCIIPLQDWLGLGWEARINTPGQAEGNWTFRIRQEMLTGELVERMQRMSRVYGRL